MRKSILMFIPFAAVLAFFSMLPAESVGTEVKAAVNSAPVNLRIPSLAFDEKSIVLIWNKPEKYSDIVDYHIYMDGRLSGSANANNDAFSPAKAYINKFYEEDKGRFHYRISIHNYTAAGLKPDTQYTFTVRAVYADGKESPDSNKVVQKTTASPKIYNVRDFGARGDGVAIDTAAIQSAIDACSSGGKVLIPQGIFKSGALFLKSNMTLEIAEGGTLLGSDRAEDFPLNKGYRIYSYSTNDRPPSLINALGEKRSAGTFENIRIVGKGTIDGNGWKFAEGSFKDELGKDIPVYSGKSSDGILAKSQMGEAIKSGLATMTAYGQRRSSLITVRGVRNMYYADFTVLNPAFHGLMNLECENVTLNGLTHKTFDTGNGDGVEFGNSNNTLVINNFFDTGDDCVNFAAGTGLEAEKQPPMKGSYIFNNYFRKGHGAVVMGSHTGAWITDIFAEDNVINGTDVGLRCKSTLINGGGAKNILFRDSALKNIVRQAYVFTLDYFDPGQALDYTPAKIPGKFQDIVVRNNTVENSAGGSPVIQVKGDVSKNAYHENIFFENITCINVNTAQLEGLKKGTFRNVQFKTLKDSNIPWVVIKSENLKFEGTTEKP